MNLIKNIAYRSLDAVTLGRGVKRVIDGRPIRFPARVSRFYSNVYDPATFDFLTANVHEGDTVLDIGAHVGIFSVAMAGLVGSGGRVFAFEPTPSTNAVLRQVIELNGCGDVVEVRGEAVSKERGSAVFYDTGDVSNANSLVHYDQGAKEHKVDLISIDSLAAERDLAINCIKIDVEGAELDVLIGAEKTFSTMRPPTRLGLHPAFIAQNGQSLDDIWRLLTDYRLTVMSDDKPAEREWFCSQPDLFDVNLLPS